MIWGGTPQSFMLVSRKLIILASLTAKVLKIGHTSSRDALRALAALITAAPFSTSSRSAGKFMQTFWASEGPGAAAGGPNPPPPCGAKPPPPGGPKPPLEGPTVMAVGAEPWLGGGGNAPDCWAPGGGGKALPWPVCAGA